MGLKVDSLPAQRPAMPLGLRGVVGDELRRVITETPTGNLYLLRNGFPFVDRRSTIVHPIPTDGNMSEPNGKWIFYNNSLEEDASGHIDTDSPRIANFISIEMAEDGIANLIAGTYEGIVDGSSTYNEEFRIRLGHAPSRDEVRAAIGVITEFRPVRRGKTFEVVDGIAKEVAA